METAGAHTQKMGWGDVGWRSPKGTNGPSFHWASAAPLQNLPTSFLLGSRCFTGSSQMGWIMLWVQNTRELGRYRLSSPSYVASAQLQSPSDYICTASGNSPRALIVQITHTWYHWWLLLQQCLKLWVFLSLTRSPGVLGLHEEAWKPLWRYQKGPDFHAWECSAPAVLYEWEDRRHQPSLHLDVNEDEDQASSWTWSEVCRALQPQHSFPATHTHTHTLLLQSSI